MKLLFVVRQFKLNEMEWAAEFEVEDEPTCSWLKLHSMDADGYSLHALVDSIARSKLANEYSQLKFNPASDRLIVYAMSTQIIEALVEVFNDTTNSIKAMARALAESNPELVHGGRLE